MNIDTVLERAAAKIMSGYVVPCKLDPDVNQFAISHHTTTQLEIALGMLSLKAELTAEKVFA